MSLICILLWHGQTSHGLCVDIMLPLSRCIPFPAPRCCCPPCVHLSLIHQISCFMLLYSQKRLSSVCLHQESASRLWTQRGQATQTTRHIQTPIDQMLPSFFFSVYPVPPLWHSLWRCCFIPLSWWESVLLLWDVCLSHSTIKGPACTRVCLAWASVVDEWAVRARSSWKQALSNRIPWRQGSQWGDERSARNGQARQAQGRERASEMGRQQCVKKAQLTGRRFGPH